MCVSGPVYRYVLALNKAALEKANVRVLGYGPYRKSCQQGRPFNFSNLYVRETPNAIFYSGSVNFFLVLPFILT